MNNEAEKILSHQSKSVLKPPFELQSPDRQDGSNTGLEIRSTDSSKSGLLAPQKVRVKKILHTTQTA